MYFNLRSMAETGGALYTSFPFPLDVWINHHSVGKKK